MIQQGQQQALALFQLIAERLDGKLKTPIKTFFLSLITGALLAIARRRTVTQWLQAAGLSEKYRNTFYHMPDIGRKSQELFDEMLKCIIEQLGDVLETATYIRLRQYSAVTCVLTVQGASYAEYRSTCGSWDKSS